MLACLLAVPFLAGCGEDRSNLIPGDTASSLIAKLNEVDQLVAEGNCFEAKEVAASAQDEIEALDENIDPKLKRSLRDGVTQLQVFVGDPGKCTESETVITEEPEDTVDEPIVPENTTGETGTTDSEGTTGDQGTTDENQATEQPQGGENGQNPTTPNPSNPTAPTTPTTPTNPTTPADPPSGPGSGGLGPG